MPHVLVVGPLHASGLAVLKAAPDVTFDEVNQPTLEAYAPFAPKADAILIRTQPMPASVIATAPRLKIVSRHGVGYDAVDVKALNARNIPLAIVGDVNSVAVAEHTLMFMLALSKQTTTYDAAVRGTGWGTRNRFTAFELSGKTLLLLGFGRIGRLVAKRAAAFGMRVEAFDPFIAAPAIEAGGAVPVPSIESALPRADIVSVHMPRADGKAILGAVELALLKPTAVVINTARGGLIDEAALAVALSSGRLAGAGLDVFDAEPPPPDHPLLREPRAILSPHIAGLSIESAERMAVSSAQNILDFFAGKLDPALVVNHAAITQKS
jgi:D-3-phosphoglycerate dehydrogenase / 2-oxoglutarate reductase